MKSNFDREFVRTHKTEIERTWHGRKSREFFGVSECWVWLSSFIPQNLIGWIGYEREFYLNENFVIYVDRDIERHKTFVLLIDWNACIIRMPRIVPKLTRSLRKKRRFSSPDVRIMYLPQDLRIASMYCHVLWYMYCDQVMTVHVSDSKVLK
jgi:hypothetical protein